MINKESIKKLNDHLRKGDQSKIAMLAGVSKPTVNRFLNGNDDCVSEETASRIIEKAAIVIKARKKLQEKNEKMIESATKSN